MAADGLATGGARASAANVLNYFYWNIPASSPEMLWMCNVSSNIKLSDIDYALKDIP